MGVFIEPPFWAGEFYGRPSPLPHAISLLVTPAVAVAASSVANPTVITTTTPHGFVSGDTIAIAGHLGSTPAVDGSRVVTVLTPTSFSIPLNVTVGGTGGTVTRTVAVEPLTLAEGKLRAGLDWADGDARDGLMTGFIASARHKVEQDTGLALLTQTRDIYFDAMPRWRWRTPLELPAHSRPLQAVTWIKYTDTGDVLQTLDPSQYVVDVASGRIGLSLSGIWPLDVRPFQPFVIRIVSGWPTVAQIPAPLVHAVGLLTAHYATVGRDIAAVERVSGIEVPFGYREAIEPYCLVWVA